MKLQAEVPDEWEPKVRKAMEILGVGKNQSRYIWLLVWQNLRDLGLLGVKNGESEETVLEG
jgi:hypothetical protein